MLLVLFETEMLEPFIQWCLDLVDRRYFVDYFYCLTFIASNKSTVFGYKLFLPILISKVIYSCMAKFETLP